MKSLSQADCQRVHSLFKETHTVWMQRRILQTDRKGLKLKGIMLSLRSHTAGNQWRNWSGFVSLSCLLHCCSAEHTPGLRLSAAALHCCSQYLYAGRPLPLHSPQPRTHDVTNDPFITLDKKCMLNILLCSSHFTKATRQQLSQGGQQKKSFYKILLYSCIVKPF